MSRKKQLEAHNAPLKEGEDKNNTIGCRHTNPDICASYYLENVCAFASEDGICKNPGKGWKKKYLELLEGDVK